MTKKDSISWVEQETNTSKKKRKKKLPPLQSPTEIEQAPDLEASDDEEESYKSRKHSTPKEEDKIKDRYSRKKSSVLDKFSAHVGTNEGNTSTGGDGGKSKVILKNQTSRYEDRFRIEDKSAQDAYERHEKKKEVEKDGNEDEKTKNPSREDAYDFFTKVWETEEEQSKPATSPVSTSNELKEGNPDEAEAESQSDDTKILVKDILGDRFDYKDTEMTYPTIVKENPSENIYCPSTKKIPIDKKIDGTKPAYFLEEEGVYVEPHPPTIKRNQNKLEARILNEDKGKIWFGHDGKLIASSLRVREKSSRPSVFEEPDQDLETEFVLPISTGRFLREYEKPLRGCRLEIDISSLIFDHHHLFSIEHHLTRKILEFYEEYRKNLNHEKESDFDRKLEILYVAVVQVKSDDSSQDVEKDFEEFKMRRIQSYRDEIYSLRRDRDRSRKQERELVGKILLYWKYLRDLRKKQGYAITNQKISIHKEKVADPDEEFRKWNEDIEREVNDEREDYIAAKKELEKRYKQSLEEWKTHHAQRKEARKRQKQRQKSADEGCGTADMADIASDERILSKPETDKPMPPSEFDENQVRERIKENALRSRKPPGEPRIYVELTNNASHLGSSTAVNKEGIHDNREKIRRNSTSKTKISARVFFNGKEVCQSSPAYMSQDFTVSIGRIFPIHILQWPESVKLQIIEGSLLKTTILSEVSVPLCDSSTTLESGHLEPIPFTSDLKIEHDHSGIGSCVDFPINVNGSDIKSSKIKGKVFARLGWGKTPTGEIAAPSASKWKPPRSLKRDPLSDILNKDGSLDPDKLESWMRKSRVDPNNPSNAELMGRIADAASKIDQNQRTGSFLSANTETTEGNYFRLDQRSDQFVFATSSDLENNLRFQLLQLRNAKVPEFKNFRMVPVSEKEIPRGLLEAREKKAAATRKDVIGSGNPLRSKSRLFLERLRTRVSHRFSLARHKKGRADIVIEDPIPSAQSLLTLFGEMMPAQRPLRPTRIERPKVLIHDMTGHDIRISLTVVRAFDVPVRCDSDTIQSSTSLKTNPNTSKEILRESKVNSYVEARFQGDSARTNAAAGPNPTWNEQLSLSFKSRNNDYSPDSLNCVNEDLLLQLFDEIVVDMSKDEEDSSDHIHQRLEKNWLGSLVIPFSSIYKNTRIEGTFRLYSPPVLLGYERVNSVSGFSESNHGDNKEATYINVYVTIQPALAVPDHSIKEKLDCQEPEVVISYCEKWYKEMKKSHPERAINPLVVNVSGKSVLMTRFLREIDPPEDIIPSEGNADPSDNAAWFVSLIPYIPSNALFPGLKNIWPTSDQVMNMMVGSEAEHAILLANYFLSLKKCSYIVLGQGIPEGDTVYVLSVEESGERWLWNSVTGERFRTGETFCPLTRVYAVLNENNLWGNLQSWDHPARIRWDFSTSSDWLPLFGRTFPNPGNESVQPEKIPYLPADARAAKNLREKLERSLRDSLMNLRPRSKTSLNFHGNAVLRKLLPGLESSRGGLSRERKNLLSDHLSELQRINASYKVCGFPLHFPLTEIEDVVKGLKSTGVYSNKDPDVEFALAVDVRPYPNTVMSVWVYIASLIKRA